MEQPHQQQQQQQLPPAPGAGGPDAIDGEIVPTLNGYARARIIREVGQRPRGSRDLD
jgi:hypothetical protein